MDTTSAVLRRIHKVRKIKQRNIHDCAAFLNITKEDYLQFEQGTKMLSLPEVELLAHYFGVRPAVFFRPTQWKNERLNLLDDHIQHQFSKLRNKMILAKVLAEMRNQAMTVEDLSEKTGISLEVLHTYQNSEKTIPLDHLLQISKVIGLTEQDLLDPVWQVKAEQNHPPIIDKVQHKNMGKKIQEKDGGNSIEQLMTAIHQLPKKDQAEVAKTLLGKLKSLKNG